MEELHKAFFKNLLGGIYYVLWRMRIWVYCSSSNWRLWKRICTYRGIVHSFDHYWCGVLVWVLINKNQLDMEESMSS
jgi:hypothetical protein